MSCRELMALFASLPAPDMADAAFASMCGAIHMVDEVRRVAPGLYLGIGTWGFSQAQRRVPLPVVLVGPGAPYAQGIGTPKPGFNIDTEIPALQNQGSHT